MDSPKVEYMLLEEVDSLRDEYETDSKWKSRSQFMIANLDSIPKKRLITLSNCYVNIKHDGCKYAPALMKELDELVANIPTAYPGKHGEDKGAKRYLEDASTAASKRFQGMQAIRKKQGNQQGDGVK